MPTIHRRSASLLVVLALASNLPVRALDFVVTRYDDPAPDGCAPANCSLREAVIAANALATADRILLSAGAYVLSIPGADEDAGATGDLDLLEDVEILGVGAGVTTVDGAGLDRIFDAREETTSVRLAGLTLRGGVGATSSDAAALRLSRATVELDGCELRDNAPGRQVLATLFSHLVLRDSAVIGGVGSGSGVVISQASADLENVTVTGHGGTELAVNSGATVTCRHCTLVDVDLVLSASNALAVSMTNSVIVGQCSAGPIVSSGGNLESPGATCAFDEDDDQVNVADPGLGALALAGGATRTIPLAATSPARDAARAAECLGRDQRGALRPAGGDDCDAGAFELVTPDPPTPIFIDGFLQGDAEAWSVTQG